jgi:hypothetical protein
MAINDYGKEQASYGGDFSETNCGAIPVSLSANENAFEDPRYAAGADRSIAQIHLGRGLCELRD